MSALHVFIQGLRFRVNLHPLSTESPGFESFSQNQSTTRKVLLHGSMFWLRRFLDCKTRAGRVSHTRDWPRPGPREGWQVLLNHIRERRVHSLRASSAGRPLGPEGLFLKVTKTHTATRAPGQGRRGTERRSRLPRPATTPSQAARGKSPERGARALESLEGPRAAGPRPACAPSGHGHGALCALVWTSPNGAGGQGSPRSPASLTGAASFLGRPRARPRPRASRRPRRCPRARGVRCRDNSTYTGVHADLFLFFRKKKVLFLFFIFLCFLFVFLRFFFFFKR